MAKIAILYTTVAKRTDARKLTKTLLDAKVVACAVAVDAESSYTWGSKREQSKEIALICKTSVKALSRAKKTLAAAHPYTTPCILNWAVEANSAYAQWVTEQTR